jgi:hypothetical protein
MKRFPVLFGLVLWCASAWAQTGSQVVSEVNLATPKPGMQSQFEEGRKRHSAFHAAQKDTWSIYVWEITTGDRTGSFMMASPGHNWKDLDAREAYNKIDLSDVTKNLTPYTSAGGTSYYVWRDDLSLTKPIFPPAKMRTSVYYSVIPEHLNDFTDAIKKINEAVRKASYPAKPSRWYQLANGGEVPAFVLITDRATWGDMEPLDKKLEDVLKEAYGDTGPQVLDQLRKSCHKIVSEMSVYRADLSYVPK